MKNLNKRYVGLCVLGMCMMASCSEKEFTTDMPENRLITSVELDVTPELPLLVGTDSAIVYRVAPEDADIKDLKWSSSNELVAGVSDDGTISALSVGNAMITVTPSVGFGRDETVKTIFVSVISEIIGAESIEFTNAETTLYETDQLQLTYNILPEDHTYSYLTWSSSDESVATVDKNGVVTGVKAGKVTIYAHTHDKTGVMGKYELEVMAYIPATEVDITEPESKSLYMDQILDLAFTSVPKSAAANSIVWSSSDESVLTVDGGKVTAVGFGTATVTATCENKQSSSVALTVESGWYVWDDVTNGFSTWYSNTSGASAEHVDDKLVINVAAAAKRADLKLIHNNPNNAVNMDFGNYPVLAFKSDNVSAAYSTDIVSTQDTGNIQPAGSKASKIDLNDGTVLVYCETTKEEAKTLLPYRTVGFKVTNIPEQYGSYKVYWIRTFKSVGEMKEFAGVN